MAAASFSNKYEDFVVDEELSRIQAQITANREVTGVAHSFYLDDFVVPRFCDVCSDLIWGFSRQGETCSSCGMTIHRRCSKMAKKTCKLVSPTSNKRRKLQELTHCKTTCRTCKSSDAVIDIRKRKPPQKAATISKDESGSKPKHVLRFRHSWVEGTLPLTAMCFVCNGPIMFYDGCECVRCENMAHTDCLTLSDICKPRHRHLIFVEEIDMPKHPLNEQDFILDEGEVTKRTPLLVLINARSGGNLGERLVGTFSDLLTPEQVFMIDQDGPTPILNRFKYVKNLRILACGGDGTIGWIMNCLDDARANGSGAYAQYPPVAILPLGTGNDLARTLGWGPCYNGESVSNILNQIELARTQGLDRWKIRVIPQKKNPPKGKKLATTSNVQEPKEYELIMNNYMSIGIDAQVCLDFHETRKENPSLFPSQMINRMWYLSFGAKNMFSDLQQLNDVIELYVDDERVFIPKGASGLLFLNIRHYGGGSDYWGQRYIKGEIPADFPQIHGDNGNPPILTLPSLDDHKLEVCCMWSSFHLAQISIDLSRARRLVQGNHIKIHFIQDIPFPVQMDGEPSRVSGVDLEITHQSTASMLVPIDSKNKNSSD